MLEQLKQVLIDNGGENAEMTFDDFTGAAYAARVQPQMWLKAKHAGLVTTEIREGVLYIRAILPVPTP